MDAKIRHVSAYVQDELSGFVHQSLVLPEEDDGPLRATLIRTADQSKRSRGAVVSLHGYCDYFFQAHVARHFEARGYRFYALDQRRSGRSLLPRNIPHFLRSAEDPFRELTWALETIHAEGGGPIVLLAHSTGCLTGALYAKRGPARDLISRLVLNSPFLEFPVEGLLRRMLGPVAAIGAVWPRLKAPASLGVTYGKTLHNSQSGEWDYDLLRKPLGGFPIRSGWIRAVLAAQEEIHAGLALETPVLILHSDRSTPPSGIVNRAAHTSDAVLNVAHMAKFGPRIGSSVTIEVIPSAKHDVFLSREPVRRLALEKTDAFLDEGAAPES